MREPACSRRRLPHPAAFLAGFVAVAGGLSVLIVTLRASNAVLTLMLVPVVFAALFYGRAVYLPMIGALSALDLWIISYVSMDTPGEAAGALVVLLLAGTLMAEIVHRLTRERARAEDAVRASEAHFRSLIENSSDISAFVDAHGVVVYGSPSIQRVLGFDPAELVGRNVLGYLHPADAAQVERTFDHALQGAGNHEPLGLRFRHKDGTWRHLEAVLVCRQLSPGEPPAVVINCRDVTERKRADEELAMERNVLRLLIDSIPDNIYIKDREGRLVIANAAMARRFGMNAPADLIGKTDFDLFEREVAERYRERELRVIRVARRSSTSRNWWSTRPGARVGSCSRSCRCATARAISPA
jgi:PAS domain S-box-containing protein